MKTLYLGRCKSICRFEITTFTIDAKWTAAPGKSLQLKPNNFEKKNCHFCFRFRIECSKNYGAF